MREFQSKILDLKFETIESFQNADGSRVASRWRVRGRNNGLFGLPPDGRLIEFTGTAVWALGADGKLLHNLGRTQRVGDVSASDPLKRRVHQALA